MQRLIFTLWVAAALTACTKDSEPLPGGPDLPADTSAPSTPEPDAMGPGMLDAAPAAPVDASMGSEDSDVALPAEDSGPIDGGATAVDGGAMAMDATAPNTMDASPPVLVDGALDGGTDADAAPPPEPLPPGECVGQAPDPDRPAPAEIPEDTCMNCEGAPSPNWRLEDFQPLSCGLGQTYGVDTFHGAPTLVALFNAGCGYCQNQCGKLEEMRIEFSLTNFEAHLLAVNSASNSIYQDRLAARCSIPLFQDTEEDLAMESMDGSVFDMYIYRPDGTLHVYLSGRGDIETTLSDLEGYENVKAAIVSAAAGTPYEPPFPPMAEPDGGGIPILPPLPIGDAGAGD